MNDQSPAVVLAELLQHRPQEAIPYLEQHLELMIGRLDTPEDDRYGGNHLIHKSCGFWQTPVLEYLLSRGVDPNTRGCNGKTPLHAAASEDNLAGVRLLLSAGADPNARDDDGLPPLDRCVEDQGEVFQALLDAGAEPRLVPALAQGRTDIVAELVRTLSFDQLQGQAGNESIFEYADWHDNREELVALLQQAGFEE